MYNPAAMLQYRINYSFKLETQNKFESDTIQLWGMCIIERERERERERGINGREDLSYSRTS